jgi:glycosyltransferase involved in cell wall biosynthesis
VKLWLVGHAYVNPVPHDKLAVLSRLPGVELTLLVPTSWRIETREIPLAVTSAPYRIVASRVSANGRIGAYRYREGMRALARAKPDVVHAEVEPWSLAALQCARAAPGARLVVFTWENLEGPRRLASRAIERFVLRRAAFVIAGNEAARARVLRRGVAPARTAVMPQVGLDPERYAGGARARLPAGLAPAPPAVGYVGRLIPAKGVDLLVDAVAGLDARLAVIGEGSERAALTARTAGWPAGKAVFAGGVPDDRIPDWLAALDVLVLPSRTTPAWAEQFGHVLIEAMAAGVPVIGSSSGAIPEVIGDAGLIFPEGDAAALGRQLGWLLGDGGLRKTLAERGRERVRRLWTHDVMARAHADIYARVLGR